jgi:2,4-dienoyl-CoA reductase (NADPH2)
MSYVDVLLHDKSVGRSVAVIGAGGIGFDVSEFLVHQGTPPSVDKDLFLKEWGIDPTLAARAGIEDVRPEIEPPAREIYLMQRKTSKLGQNLGKTTGWIHRSSLQHKRVKMIPGASYDAIDDQGLHITVDGESRLLAVDNIVICTGQESRRDLQPELEAAGMKVHLIGGAELAGELDAKRAIDQGCRLAAAI